MLLVMESVGVAFCNRGGWDGVGGVGEGWVGEGEGEGNGGEWVGGWDMGCGLEFSFSGYALMGIG